MLYRVHWAVVPKYKAFVPILNNSLWIWCGFFNRVFKIVAIMIKKENL